MNPALYSIDHLNKCFSDTYREAHDRFIACFRKPHDHSRYKAFVYRESGPENEKLITAIGWQGNPKADRLLVIQSATHGVEGFAGSAIQLDTLATLPPSALRDDTAILHIHALNPFGFAWLRRVNEEGVDLNRNFIDFDAELPSNPGYLNLADDLLPHTDEDWDAANQRLHKARSALGQTAFEQAVTGGQYTMPEGLFYGGTKPSQSRRHLEEIIDVCGLRNKQKIAVIDIHTGLGPFGYGEVICDHPPNSAGIRLAREWFGDSVTEPALGSSSSVPKLGLVDYFWHDILPDHLCFITLEFGTYPMDRLLTVLRQDHSLHRGQPDWTSPQCQAVKSAIRKNFYPATPDWQEMILVRGRQLILQALNGLQHDAQSHTQRANA